MPALPPSLDRRSPAVIGADLDHVAVAVERAADAWSRYAGGLGGRWAGGAVSPGFWFGQVRYANGTKVEVLEPFEVERNDFLRRFLDRNGPGVHHLTYKVPDIEAALAAAEAAGYRPVGVDLSDPDWKEAFLHPKDAPGVVVQLAQGGSDESGDEWGDGPPPGFPAPTERAGEPAVLARVAHAVADLDKGLALFAGLLGGEEVGRGDDGGPWVDLAWPGPGRLRLLHASGALGGFLAGRAGRVHHLAFRHAEPGAVTGAAPVGDGTFEVAPEANLGVRLRLEGA